MLPCCPAFAIMTAKIFSEAEKNSLEFNALRFKAAYFISFLIFLIFSVLTAIGVYIYDSGPAVIFLLPVVILIGAISLIWFYGFKSCDKMVLSLSIVLVLTFSSLSGDVLPLVNQYPMKKFANYINQENFKGPIAVYKLGNNRVRLGVLTGRPVAMLHSQIEIEKFLRTNQKIYLVIKKSDWEKENFNPEIKIVDTDQVGIKVNLRRNEIMNLFDMKKLRQKLNSTETLYFVSNK